MSSTLKHAKLDIEIFIHTLAKEKGIQLDAIQWRQPTPPSTKWAVEVKSSTGQKAYQDFSPEQLLGFRNNKQLKTQVIMKVNSLINHL